MSSKERREEIKKLGLCERHPSEPVVKGSSRCQKCLDRRAKVRKAGFCVSHESNLVLPGKLRCQECVDKRKAKDEKRKSDGVCCDHPDIPAVPGKTKCAECLLGLRLWSLGRRGLSKKELRRAEKALKNSNGLCEICFEKLTNTKKTHVDHDHDTNKFRGILCNQCNIMLGYARNNPVILESGAAYIRKKKD
jgi:hypothetical protein